MPADSLVVDASAIAAFLFNEPAAPQIEKQLTRRTLVAPSLLTYEVASAARKKTDRYPDQAQGIRSALGLLGELRIEYVQAPSTALFDLAEELGLSTYDASYLWLARDLRIPLLTLDKTLRTAAKKAGIAAVDPA